MTNQRYPAGVAVSAQNFTDSGWKAVLKTASRDGYSAMWQAESDKGVEENDDN